MTTSQNSPFIYNLSNVSKSYPSTVAVDDVSISVKEGELVALVGPSGSGKTSLLRLMAGTIPTDKGNISLTGRDISTIKTGKELSSLVGTIHQQFDIVPHLSVIHNVLAGRLGQWGLLKSILSLISPFDKHLAVEALNRVGISDKLNERTSNLSGGEQQRVAIARILVQNPRIILADEPVSSLDPARANDILELLTEVAAESSKTLITSIHSVDLALKHYTRVIGLRNGRVTFDLPAHQVNRSMLGELYELEGLRGEGIAS